MVETIGVSNIPIGPVISFFTEVRRRPIRSFLVGRPGGNQWWSTASDQKKLQSKQSNSSNLRHENLN